MSISIDYLFDASVDVTAIPLCNLIVFGIFGNLMVVINTKGNCVRIKERALIASLAFADTLESLNLWWFRLQNFDYSTVLVVVACSAHRYYQLLLLSNFKRGLRSNIK